MALRSNEWGHEQLGQTNFRVNMVQQATREVSIPKQIIPTGNKPMGSDLRFIANFTTKRRKRGSLREGRRGRREGAERLVSSG